MSFAIDLLTTITFEETKVTKIREDVVIEKGSVNFTDEQQFTHKYIARTRAATLRNVLIEKPIVPGRKLIAPEKATEQTKDHYRFLVTVKPDAPQTLTVVEQANFDSHSELIGMTHAQIVDAKEKTARPAVKAMFDRVLAIRAEMDANAKAIAFEQNSLKQIETDQTRLRANIEKVPPASEAFKRYLKKFDEQETEIETRRKKVIELTTIAETKAAELSDFGTKATAK